MKPFLRLPILVAVVCVVGLGVFVAAAWSVQRQPPDLGGGPVTVPSSSGTTPGASEQPSPGPTRSRPSQPAGSHSYAACEVEPGTPLPAGDDADDSGDDHGDSGDGGGRDADDGREDADACDD